MKYVANGEHYISVLFNDIVSTIYVMYDQVRQDMIKHPPSLVPSDPF
jgi:hypothetical protein